MHEWLRFGLSLESKLKGYDEPGRGQSGGSGGGRLARPSQGDGCGTGTAAQQVCPVGRSGGRGAKPTSDNTLFGSTMFLREGGKGRREELSLCFLASKLAAEMGTIRTYVGLVPKSITRGEGIQEIEGINGIEGI